MGGMFKLVNEHGVPLSILLFKLDESGCVLDWQDFVQDALEAGWTIKGLTSRVEEALIDSSYNKISRDEILSRLKLLVVKLYAETQESEKFHAKAHKHQAGQEDQNS